MPQTLKFDWPKLLVEYDDNGKPSRLWYDDRRGHVVDLTETMSISKIAWSFNVDKGLNEVTITFDAMIDSSMPS